MVNVTEIFYNLIKTSFLFPVFSSFLSLSYIKHYIKNIDILPWPYGHLRLSNLLFPALVTLAPKIVFVTGKMTNVME